MNSSFWDSNDPNIQKFVAQRKREFTRQFCDMVLKDCRPFLKSIKTYKRKLFLIGNGFASIPDVIRETILYWQHSQFGFCQPSSFTLLNKSRMGRVLDRFDTYPSFTTSKALSESCILAFPIGEFEVFWSPLVPSINLLFKHFVSDFNEKGHLLNSIASSKELKQVLEHHYEELHNLRTSQSRQVLMQSTVSILRDLQYRLGDFYHGYNSGNEIHFNCIGFYSALTSELDVPFLVDRLND